MTCPKCGSTFESVNLKTGVVECFDCGLVFEKPVGKSKVYSNIVKGLSDKDGFDCSLVFEEDDEE